MSRKHTQISPSAADRWICCPGSIQAIAELGTKQESSVYAAEGTMMHEVAERCWIENTWPSNFIGSIHPIDGFDIEFTEDHAEIVDYYLSVLQKLVEENPGAVQKTESRVNLKEFGWPNISGLLDFSLDTYMEQLIICDLKTGQGVSVDADSNQLKLYALMQAGKDVELYKTIKLIVVQPRDRSGERFKVHEMPGSELYKWYLNVASPAIKDCLSDNPRFQPGEKQCRWCPCNGRCQHLAKFSLSVAINEFDDFDKHVAEFETPDITTLSNEQLANVLRIFPLFDIFRSAVIEAAIRELQNGRSVPGYKLVEGKSNRAWNCSEDELVPVLKSDFKLKVSQIYKKKLEGPAKIEKLVKSRPNKDDLKKYIVKPKGKETLVPIDDVRQDINKLSAADEFDAEDIFS